MKVSIRKIKDLAAIKRTIDDLNLFRDDNGFSGTLNELSKGRVPKVFYAAFIEKECVGWSSKFDEDVHIYIKRDFQRKGIGTKLFKKMLTLADSVIIFPWNFNSRQFFSRFYDNKKVAIGIYYA